MTPDPWHRRLVRSRLVLQAAVVLAGAAFLYLIYTVVRP